MGIKKKQFYQLKGQNNYLNTQFYLGIFFVP